MDKTSRRQAMRLLAASGAAISVEQISGQSPSRSSKSLLIRGGTVVNASGQQRADVLIRGEQIEAVGPDLQEEGAKVIAAHDKFVLPGGIDPHTHLHRPFADDFASGSKAALAGGITTVGSFANLATGNDGLLEAIEAQAEKVRSQSIADVMLHAVLWPPTEDLVREVPSMVEHGHTSIKIFMFRRDFDTHLENLLRLLDVNAKHGVVSMLHCEDASTLAYLEERLVLAGKDSLEYYAESRPVIAEVMATQRAAALCELTGAPVYLVHLSAKRALDACAETRRRGFPLYVETRPLFLHFTKDAFDTPDGALYLGQPPLREEHDREALWEGLRERKIDVVATDHAPWTREQKTNPAPTITKFRPGAADLQVMLPMLFSEGVGEGRFSIERFVELSSHNPAKLFGLYPRKGHIEVGAEADIVIWDPANEKVVRGSEEYSKAGFSIYEGRRIRGWPEVTIRRGEVVYANGEIIGEHGSGRVVERGPSSPL